MLSKSKLFKAFSSLRKHSYGGDIHTITGVCNIFCQSLCNMTESVKVDDSEKITESPEIPGWVKFSKSSNLGVRNSEDNFVLPTSSYWVDSQKRKAEEFEVNVISSDNDADEISKILKNRFASHDAVVQALNGCGISVSESLVGQMLKRFKSDWKQGFGLFKWAELQRGVRHSPELYNLMVDNLGRARKFDLMWDLVEEMHHLSECITLVTMSHVMRRLAKAGRYEEAIEAFKKLEQYGLSKDVEALNALINTLVKEKSVEHAHSVYLEFKSHIPPNLHTFNTLIHGWCKARQLDKAQNTIQDMKERGFSPDVFSYSCFIEAYCYEKDFQKVDSILEEMQENGCAANVVTYTIIMHARGKAKEISEALEIYEKMKRSGCISDSSFYSSLIYILSKAGRLKDARDIFEDMPKQGVTPDVLTYNTMIKAACQHTQEENALKLLREMEENHCEPDLNTYDPLLKMCCKMRRIKVLAFLLSHMFKNGVNIELGTYALLVRGLCKSGLLRKACSFFEEAVVMRGFVPWDSMYETLVKELQKTGLKEEKGRIEELMSQAKEQKAADCVNTSISIQDELA